MPIFVLVIKPTMKTILLITLFCSFFAGCKKNNSVPNGENVIRYKVNGTQVEISGKYNSLSKNGVIYTYKSSKDYNLINGSSSDGSILLSISNSAILNTINFSNNDSISPYQILCLTHSNSQELEYNSIINSIKFIITINTNLIESGTFSGLLYRKNLNSVISDSINITDGYFDISKQ